MTRRTPAGSSSRDVNTTTARPRNPSAPPNAWRGSADRLRSPDSPPSSERSRSARASPSSAATIHPPTEPTSERPTEPTGFRGAGVQVRVVSLVASLVGAGDGVVVSMPDKVPFAATCAILANPGVRSAVPGVSSAVPGVRWAVAWRCQEPAAFLVESSIASPVSVIVTRAGRGSTACRTTSCSSASPYASRAAVWSRAAMASTRSTPVPSAWRVHTWPSGVSRCRRRPGVQWRVWCQGGGGTSTTRPRVRGVMAVAAWATWVRKSPVVISASAGRVSRSASVSNGRGLSSVKRV